MRFAAASIALSSIFISTLAFANDPAAAQALFSDARKLMNDGKFSEACPKLEESENLDPGMGTLYNLGDCYEHVGRTASAWAAFDEVANEARAAASPAREQDARGRSTALLPQLAHMTIDASAIKSLPGVEISRDGTSVGAPQWGLSIPVDPGDHTIIAAAQGKKSQTVKVTVAPHEAKVITLPMLESAPIEASSLVGDNPHETAKGDGKTQRTLGLALAGLGVVGLGVGVVFTLLSKGAESSSNNGDCDPNTNICKTANGVSQRSTAIVDGDISTAAFIAGLVLGGAGVTLWATAPKSHAPQTTGKWSVTPDVAFGQNGASFGMRGHF